MVNLFVTFSICVPFTGRCHRFTAVER